MKPTVRQPFTFTAFSACIALAAAVTLAACDPSDGAGTAQLAAAPTATAVPPIERPGTPVPAPIERAGTPVRAAALAPAPTLPAQSSSPTRALTGAPVPDDAVPTAPPAPRAVDRSRAGAIAGIEPIRERPQGSGAGAVIGGVLGGVLGNQFGSGTGKAVMTGAGAVGGAIAGNNIERNRNTRVVGYRVHVRLDDGTTRTFRRAQVGDLHVGDRVALDARSFHRV